MKSVGCNSRGTASAAAVLSAALCAWGHVQAQVASHVEFKGLQDLELFKTDPSSLLLSKNEGELAGAGRLRLWGAAEFMPSFQGLILGELEGGKAEEESGVSAEIEQAFLRYTSTRAHLMVDAGRVVSPVGNFSKRYLSNVNPLIAGPDSYDVVYPEGVVVTGTLSWFDYRAAVIDRPLSNEKYVPEGDRSWRPAVEVGFTPVIGLRIGAYATAGTYLSQNVGWALPAGQGWREFDQQIAGLTLEFARGHFELNGDLAFAAYAVPTHTQLSHGQAWFLEPKYTFTPRFFTALRIEKNDYPYIQPIDSTLWIAQNVAFHDVEAGVGWRFTPDLILKASYRRDRWDVSDDMKEYFPNGYAWGMQLSYGFDVRSWFEPR